VQTSRRRLAMTRQAVGEISMPIPRAEFNAAVAAVGGFEAGLKLGPSCNTT
jgi:hypothetical protein